MNRVCSKAFLSSNEKYPNRFLDMEDVPNTKRIQNTLFKELFKYFKELLIINFCLSLYAYLLIKGFSRHFNIIPFSSVSRIKRIKEISIF